MGSLPPVACPPRGSSRSLRIRVIRFLLLGWTPHAIAADCHISLRTIQRFARNLHQYGGIRAPAIPVLEMLLSEGWRQQEEIVFWL